MSQRLAVVLIENAFLIRAGVEQLLNELPGVALIKVFDGKEKNLLKKINDLKPEVIIINPDTLQDNHVSFINALHKHNSYLTIGLVSPSAPQNIKSHFVACLNIANGKFELLEELKLNLGNKINLKKERVKTDLTDREKTIIKQVVSGLTNQEIADKLFLSIHTVITHRKNISNKLGIKTVSGLTVYALMNKIVDIHEIEHK